MTDSSQFGISLSSSSEVLVPSITFPATVEYHAVEDGELDRLMKLEKPISFGVCLTSAGVAVGTFVPALPVWEALLAGSTVAQVAIGDVAYAVICAATAVLAVATGIVAARGKSDAQRALEGIRARPKVSLPPGHPAAPPSRDLDVLNVA